MQSDEEDNPLLNEKDARKLAERQVALEALRSKLPGIDYAWDDADEGDKAKKD